jgi:hypothetical protein
MLAHQLFPTKKKPEIVHIDLPEATEEVEELEGVQCRDTGLQGMICDSTDEQHKHHHETNILHAPTAIPACNTHHT